MRKQLVFLDESSIYGGHEAMFLAFLKYMLPVLTESSDVTFLVNSANQTLIRHLQSPDYARVTVERVTLSNIPIKPLTNLLFRSDFTKLKCIVERLQPNLVVNIQGTIEIGCTGLLVCKKLRFPVVSYLPITKSSAQLGVFLGRIRDFLCRKIYYSIPSKIITISKANAQELQDFFSVSSARIDTVHNFIDKVNTENASVVSEFDKAQRHLALIGRVCNRQKCQKDFLFAWRNSGLNHRFSVHIVGDSDDAESKSLRQEFSRDEGVIFHGWQSSVYVTNILKKCDALILPSRFEGVPLVMIEAIQLGCMVIGTSVDGMKAFLPPCFTFDVGDWANMFKIVEKIGEPDLQAQLSQTQEKFEIFSKNTNVNQFLAILQSEY